MNFETLTEYLNSNNYYRIHRSDHYVAYFENDKGLIIEVRLDNLMMRNPTAQWHHLRDVLEENEGHDKMLLLMNGVGVRASENALIGTNDVARMMQITPYSVRRLKKQGKFIPICVINNRLMYTRQQVLDFIENKKQIEMLLMDRIKLNNQ